MNRLSQLEASVRHGELSVVRRDLHGFARGPLSRSERLLLATLARRCNTPLLGLRVLRSLVVDEGKRVAAPAPEEIAEYSILLTKAGAHEEALRLSSKLDLSLFPEAALARCAALFARWDYEGAVPLLERYLHAVPDGSYEQLVGRLNLAAALVVVGEIDRAEGHLSTILGNDGERVNVHAKARVVLAQCALARRDHASARELLRAAQPTIRAMGGLDEFLHRKWLALNDLLASAGASAPEVHAVRAEARRIGHWETERQCDAYLAAATRDGERFARVWYGTPYPGFRRHVLERLAPDLAIPDGYEWRPGIDEPVRGEDAGPQLELDRGDLLIGEHRLKAGQVPFRALHALSLDFYRPARLAALHELIFPGEYFNPESSSERVKQALKTLRRWLRDAALPIHVGASGGFHRLEATAPCRLVRRRQVSGKDRKTELLRSLVDRVGPRSFSCAEAATALGISHRSARRLLREARLEGKLTTEGPSREPKYRHPSAA